MEKVEVVFEDEHGLVRRLRCNFSEAWERVLELRAKAERNGRLLPGDRFTITIL